MPFFYDTADEKRPSKRRKLVVADTMARRPWEEHSRREAVDVEQDTDDRDVELQEQEQEAQKPCLETSDRQELMESIKRGERPRWVPPRGQASHDQEITGNSTADVLETSSLQNYVATNDHPLARQPHVEPEVPLSMPNTEKSRSAFHAGDFYQPSGPPHALTTPAASKAIQRVSTNGTMAISPPAPWMTPSPKMFKSRSDGNVLPGMAVDVRARARAPSLGSSRSSSFVMRTPTSPLVHSATASDQDLPHSTISAADDRVNRRRTLPPSTFGSFSAMEATSTPNFSRPLPTSRGHQPRRSLTSFTYQPLSDRTPFAVPRSRRPSLSETSPLQRASMVGSFEESILRGRMSAPPSRPLDFVAQIGVLGKGNCPPSLRCPAHVSVTFPAVFYRYPFVVGSKSQTEDHPSPYVGNIDLEHSLKSAETRKARGRHASPAHTPEEGSRDLTAPESTPIGRQVERERRKRERRKRSPSPKTPLGGSYRVPQCGQLQIIIKNPNKTAVKLFLIPYDLSDMESSTKTFVRQRSFSSGPILEKPLTDKPSLSLPTDPLKDKHVLRYLIHLKFCCTTRGRYFLYDNIRVVFANRVPDGKEKLRNETQLPEPKYSPYKPVKDTNVGIAGAKLAAEKAVQRLGSMFPSLGVDVVDGIAERSQDFEAVKPGAQSRAMNFSTPSLQKAMAHSEPSTVNPSGDLPLRPPQQFNFFDDQPKTSEPEIILDGPISPLSSLPPFSPTTGFNASTSARGSPVPWSMDGSTPGCSYSPSPLPAGEGLLARKLREKKMKQD